MSLRGRLVLGIALLSLAVFAAFQRNNWVHQRQRLEDQRADFLRLLKGLYFETPDAKESTLQWVRSVLSVSGFEVLLEDILVATSFGGGLRTELNPFGAGHRDGSFPLEEIRAGLQAAVTTETVVPAAGGLCMTVLAGEQITLSTWLRPRVPPSPVSTGTLALGTLLTVVVLGALVFWMFERSVLRPVLSLGETARKVGAGNYSARATPAEVRELQPLVSSFNSMAAKVEGHTQELSLAVRRATEEAARKERAMLQASRLAAIGTLAAGIAHEIQNPIGGMLNATLRLQKNEKLGERDRVYLDLIRDGLERISRIARRVLDFAPRQLEAAPFPLSRAIEGARALIEHRLRQGGVEFLLDLETGLPQVMGELHEIQQVLLNLFLNSLDALETQGGARRIECTARAANGSVELRVADNGPGLEPELLPRVLDPFFSTKNRPDASGLGMFISYSIVKNHGGDMELDSAKGQGFRVRIRLPAAG